MNVFHLPVDLLEPWSVEGNSFESTFMFLQDFEGDFEDGTTDFEEEQDDFEDMGYCAWPWMANNTDTREVVGDYEFDSLFSINSQGNSCTMDYTNSASMSAVTNMQFSSMIGEDETNPVVEIGWANTTASEAIGTFLTPELFAEIMPSGADALLTYEGLLSAADRVLGFCHGLNYYFDQNEGCKLELATFLAHAIFKTNSVEPSSFKEADDKDVWWTNWNSSGGVNFGQNCTTDATDCGYGVLFMQGSELPYLVSKASLPAETTTNDLATDPMLIWLSGLYEFVMPHFKPSLLSITTENWWPTWEEQEAGVFIGFGATMIVAVPDVCGKNKFRQDLLAKSWISMLEDFAFVDIDYYTSEWIDCVDFDSTVDYPKNPLENTLVYFDDSDDCNSLTATPTDFIIFDDKAFTNCLSSLNA